jgi:hypothetical protein
VAAGEERADDEADRGRAGVVGSSGVASRSTGECRRGAGAASVRRTKKGSGMCEEMFRDGVCTIKIQQSRTVRPAIRIAVAGEIDALNIDALSNALRLAERHVRLVELDLAEVTFASAALIHVLETRPAHVVVVAQSRAVTRLLDIVDRARARPAV